MARSSRLGPWNAAIAVLSLICIAFVASVVHRYWRGGTSMGRPPSLIIDYEESPFSSVEVEVLNGCGVHGLAQQFTDFFRSHGVDVIKTENADRFDYQKTLIIQRNQFAESSYRIAELLDIPKSDTTRMLIQPDLSLETDVSLIIGKDYTRIGPFQDFLSTLP